MSTVDLDKKNAAAVTTIIIIIVVEIIANGTSRDSWNSRNTNNYKSIADRLGERPASINDEYDLATTTKTTTRKKTPGIALLWLTAISPRSPYFQRMIWNCIYPYTMILRVNERLLKIRGVNNYQFKTIPFVENENMPVLCRQTIIR